ncbi:YihY/virulence factor BrkB family protein [Bradyrhizobium sp. 14AA]
MAKISKSDAPPADNRGWSLAAALGLLTVAFIWDRLAPSDNVAPPRDKDEAFPEKLEHGRDASPAVVATEGKDRGRLASAPSEIPARGWKDILLRVYGNISEHRVLALAAGMTYYGLLAIFPALAALVAIYGLFSDPGSIAKHLDEVSGFLPEDAVDVARQQLTRVASKGNQTLGLTFAIGLAVSLWSANAAMKSLFDTLNIVYGEKEKRGFVKLNALSLSFTLAGIAFVLIALGAVVVLPMVLNFIGLSKAADLLVRIARWPAMFAAVALALALIYRFGPSREAPRWRWITWGSVIATILWLGASGLFSDYPTTCRGANPAASRRSAV